MREREIQRRLLVVKRKGRSWEIVVCVRLAPVRTHNTRDGRKETYWYQSTALLIGSMMSLLRKARVGRVVVIRSEEYQKLTDAGTRNQRQTTPLSD
jgi:phage gp46-like protein